MIQYILSKIVIMVIFLYTQAFSHYGGVRKKSLYNKQIACCTSRGDIDIYDIEYTAKNDIYSLKYCKMDDNELLIAGCIDGRVLQCNINYKYICSPLSNSIDSNNIIEIANNVKWIKELIGDQPPSHSQIMINIYF